MRAPSPCCGPGPELLLTWGVTTAERRSELSGYGVNGFIVDDWALLPSGGAGLDDEIADAPSSAVRSSSVHVSSPNALGGLEPPHGMPLVDAGSTESGLP